MKLKLKLGLVFVDRVVALSISVFFSEGYYTEGYGIIDLFKRLGTSEKEIVICRLYPSTCLIPAYFGVRQ